MVGFVPSSAQWQQDGGELSPPDISSSQQVPPQVSKVTLRGKTHPILFPPGYQACSQHCWAVTVRLLRWPAPLFQQNIPQEPQQAQRYPEQGSHAQPGTAAIQHRSGKNQMLGKEESCPRCCSLKGNPEEQQGNRRKQQMGRSHMGRSHIEVQKSTKRALNCSPTPEEELLLPLLSVTASDTSITIFLWSKSTISFDLFRS